MSTPTADLDFTRRLFGRPDPEPEPETTPANFVAGEGNQTTPVNDDAHQTARDLFQNP